METKDKEVYFYQYCCKCMYESKKENESPCDICIAVGKREYSHKPQEFKEKTNGKNNR